MYSPHAFYVFNRNKAKMLILSDDSVDRSDNSFLIQIISLMSINNLGKQVPIFLQQPASAPTKYIRVVSNCFSKHLALNQMVLLDTTLVAFHCINCSSGRAPDYDAGDSGYRQGFFTLNAHPLGTPSFN